MNENNETTPLLQPVSMDRRQKEDLKLYLKRSALYIKRQIYQTGELNDEFMYEYPHSNCTQSLWRKIRNFSCLSFLLHTIPVLQWLPEYQWKKHIVGDILSGLTVAVMHIPHGMAYGILGNLSPIVGIYMGFFPVLIYFLFGTSRHVSIGTMAIVCLMTGKTVAEFSSEEVFSNSTQAIIGNEIDPLPRYTGIQIATTVTFTVALFQLAMYLFRLGIITTLMSDTLVNAFTCACAFLVVSLQLKDLFGIIIPKREGFFKIVMTVYDVYMALPTANIAAVMTSSVFIVVMVLNNEILKPRLAKITTIPFPIELTAIIAGTTLSYTLNMHKEYGVIIIGHVPKGLPEPALPVFSLIPALASDAFIIALISYTIHASLGLTFAQRSHYEIDSNQELLALGLSNCFGSFFSCMPVTSSLSRSLFQHTVGGTTQLASIVSCSVVLVVLLWIGPIFENLPRCVLASIIVVALKTLLLQFTSLKKYWILNKWDVLNWLVTFLTTVFIRIDIGLFAGIITALLTIFVQGYRPYSCLLGTVPNTDIYLDSKRYRGSKEIPGIKIFRYSGGINFALKSVFRSSLFEEVGFDPLIVLTQREKAKNSSNPSLASIEAYEIPQCIILDFSSVTCIDPSGVDMLRQLVNNYKQLNIETYIAACSGPIYETLVKCQEYQGKKNTFVFFPTIHDAVTCAQNNSLYSKTN